MSEGRYHLAIIPDGNRRWAEKEGLPKSKGHMEGAERAKDLVGWAEELPIDELTLWGLSKDNAKKRDEKELEELNKIYRIYAEEAYRGEFTTEGTEIDVNLVGDLGVLYEDTRKALEEMEEDKEKSDLILNIALGYDGRYDIAQATKRASEEHGEITEYDIEEWQEKIEEYLEVPEIDIVAGYGPDRKHLSHFANWQSGYATLYFPKKHWPDAEKEDLKEAIRKHEKRSKTRGE